MSEARPAGAAGVFGPTELLLYVITIVAWGFSWVAMHYQVGVVAPEVSVVWRFVIAAPMMMVFALVRGESLRFPLRTHVGFAALGATLFCTNFTLFYHAAQWLPSGLLSVVFSLASVINVLMAAVFFRTPITGRVVLGGLVGLFGTAAMFYPELQRVQVGSNAAIGLTISVLATVSFCSGNMISAALQRRGVPLIAGTAWGMVYGCTLLALYAGVQGRAFIIEPTWRYVGALLYLAVVASAIGFWSYLTLLRRIGAGRAAYSTVMAPLVALVVSTFAENYSWTAIAAFGLLLVLAGNVLVLGANAPKRATPPPP